MPGPLAKAVGVAIGVNRITSAVGASLFIIAGIYQLFQTINRQRARNRS